MFQSPLPAPRAATAVAAALILALAPGASAAGPHPSLPGATVPDGLGANIHFTDARPGELKMLADGGFRWIRMDFSWAGTEKERGRYDFAAYERLLASLEERKLRALFILDYSNRLYEKEASVVTEEGRAAFARWAAAAAAHFRDRGVLWEIWNEPNGGFWKPKADVNQYAPLALAAAKAIRAAAPHEAIVGPATSGVDLAFLEGCFKAGLLDWWDAVSVHPYRQNAPESAAVDYHKLRRLIARYAPRGRDSRTIPILSAEWGYSSAWQNYDPERQGKMLPRQWLTNLAENIPLSIWYDWHDDGRDPKEPEHHFGAVGHEAHAGRDPLYEPKPAYLAARALTATLGGFTFAKRIATGHPDDFALLFRKGDELRLAVWTTQAQPREVRIPSDEATFDVVAHTGEKRESIAAEDGALKVIATDAPRYLTPSRTGAPASPANAALAGAPAAHPLRATIMPVPGGMLAARIENLSDAAFSGTVRLTEADGVATADREKPVEFAPGESEKVLSFPLAAGSIENTGGPAMLADTLVAAGLRIESKAGVMLDLPARRFRALPPSRLDGCRVFADGDAKVGSEQAVEPAMCPAPLLGGDARVLKITYRFDAGWKFLRLAPARDGRAIEGEPRAFGVWVHNDGQRIAPRMRVTDAAGHTWQPGGDTAEWKGWRYIEMELTPATAHWGGAADDGAIRFPLRWDSFLIADNPGRAAIHGEVFVTAPVVIY